MAKSGLLLMKRRKSARCRVKVSVGSRASAVAERGESSSRASSPKKSPTPKNCQERFLPFGRGVGDFYFAFADNIEQPTWIAMMKDDLTIVKVPQDQDDWPVRQSPHV